MRRAHVAGRSPSRKDGLHPSKPLRIHSLDPRRQERVSRFERWALVEANLRFVVKVAFEYRS
jgi:hypothetical protein